MKILLACIVIAMMIPASTAICKTGRSYLEKYKWSDELLVTCEYKGIHFMDGSRWADAETCQRCECTKNELSCCGRGTDAGVMKPEGCTAVLDHCRPVLLNKAKTALCKK